MDSFMETFGSLVPASLQSVEGMYFLKFHRRNTYALITHVAQNSSINLKRSKNKE